MDINSINVKPSWTMAYSFIIIITVITFQMHKHSHFMSNQIEYSMHASVQCHESHDA